MKYYQSSSLQPAVNERHKLAAISMPMKIIQRSTFPKFLISNRFNGVRDRKVSGQICSYVGKLLIV